MSDLSIVIEHLEVIGLFLLKYLVEEISLNKKKRTYSFAFTHLPLLLHLLCLLSEEAESQRSQNIFIRKEDADLLLLFLLTILKIMIGIVDRDIPLLRLLTFI